MTVNRLTFLPFRRRVLGAGLASLLTALGAQAESNVNDARADDPGQNDTAVLGQVAQNQASTDDEGLAGAEQDPERAAEVNLSPEQIEQRGREAVAAIEAAATSVRAMATAAKDQRDVVKVLCLEDKSTQVGAALGTAKERAAALNSALSVSSVERGKHEYVMLMTIKDRVSTLMNEANQCIGEETGFSGDAELTVEIDQNLPEVQADVVGFVAVVSLPPGLSSAVY
jgi:hypothetical protein